MDTSNQNQVADETLANPPRYLTFHEIRQIMDLTVAQIDAAIKEATASTEIIGSELLKFSRQAQGSDAARQVLENMQFFDKLAQRLSHARAGIELVTRRLADAPPLNSPDWAETANAMRQLYSTADERVLFDFYFKGLSASNFMQALGQLRESSQSGDLDLF